MMENSIFSIVLAAGKGTRMKSELPKVIHPVFFAPMICHVLDSIQKIKPDEIVVITGHQAERVEEVLTDFPVRFARQDKQLGTGHAVLMAQESLKDKTGTALILCGDTPLIKSSTLQAMITAHHAQQSTLSVMTTIVDDPTNYGRIVTNEQNSIERIVEEKDASPSERQIKEVNAGIYCVDLSFLFSALRQVGTNNNQGEVYLTDIVGIARKEGHAVGHFVCADPLEITGVNSRVELARANVIMQQRRNQELMLDGVTMIHPDSIFVENSVTIGRDTEIHSHCLLEGNTVIGKNCSLGPFCHLNNCQVQDQVSVESFTKLRDQVIA